MKLAGRFAIITGASQGLGAAIAGQFIAEGASVLMCARSLDKLERVQSELAQKLKHGQRIVLIKADVTRTSDVDAAVTAALDEFGRIDVLVNNAGVYGPMGGLEEIDWLEWVEAININLMGTVYPCRAVLPHFIAQKYGKIINLSGGGATNALPRISAYAASKSAVVRFTETLAEEVRTSAIDVNAVAPGALATQMMQTAIAAGPDKVGREFHERMVKLQAGGGTPLNKGAELCVYLASAASDGLTGKLISAVWDPWTEFQSHMLELDGSDIYTLRRIVPSDRGKSWGDS
jgi:NAD(P)-dependent dehydrogenase (short-subunit alcohol dehydrogenase family)